MEHTDDQILELLKCPSNSKKSSKEISDLVRYIFSDHAMLANKFVRQGRQDSNRPHPHNLDLQRIANIYKSVQDLGKSSEIAVCLEKTFMLFQKQGQLKAFLQSNKQLRYFFIVILWDQLFNRSTYRLLMQKCLNLIAHTGTYRLVLSQWMDDIKTDKFASIVINMQRELENEFQKLKPKAIDQNLIKYVELNIRNSCLFLAQLYQSNSRVKRLPKQAFVCQKIREYFEPISQFKLQLKKSYSRNLIEFPFLLSIEYKLEMLKIESVFEQKVNVQKSMQMGLQSLISGIPQLDQNGGFSLQALVFLHFQINRNNILDDSMEKLGKTTQNLKSPLRIAFIGEEGADEGGVKNQYFQLLVKEIFNPYLDMFIPKNYSRVYWFNAYSYEPPIRFEFVGMLLGLAIYNSVLLDIKFPQIIYRKLLAQHYPDQEDFSSQVLEGIADIEPQTYKSMKNIREEKGSLDELQLYFNIEFQHFGEKIVEELVEDGSSIKVTQDNKNYYIQLYADYMINKHILRQFTAFKRGFDRVANGDMIHLLEPQQLEKIICGSPNVDFKELESSTSYQGFTENSPIIKNLWNVLHSFSLQEKKAFLLYVTGTDRVPIQGLKALKFTVQKHGANTNHLPTAHTCFNVLLLPEYESKQKLQERLRLALKHNHGFGLI